MRGDLYRDPHIGIRARLGELEARIEDREAEVTEAFWETLHGAERDRLSDLRSGVELAQSEALDELARAESMLAEYLATLDMLIAELPSLEAEWALVPGEVEPPPPPPRSWATGFLNPEAADRVRSAFVTMVRDRDPEAEVTTDGAVTIVARFSAHGSPFALRATVVSSANEEIGEVAMSLVTSIPRGLPPLVVRHETLVLSVGKALGIKHEVEVGEPSFDGLFLIEGTQQAADLFLVPQVRTHLLALARFDVPTLAVTPRARLASLQWHFEPAAQALDAALRILTSVRGARPSLEFRSAR